MEVAGKLFRRGRWNAIDTGVRIRAVFFIIGGDSRDPGSFAGVLGNSRMRGKLTGRVVSDAVESR